MNLHHGAALGPSLEIPSRISTWGLVGRWTIILFVHYFSLYIVSAFNRFDARYLKQFLLLTVRAMRVWVAEQWAKHT